MLQNKYETTANNEIYSSAVKKESNCLSILIELDMK